MSEIATAEPSLPDLAGVILEELKRWHDQATALWEITARIGLALRQAYRQLGEDDWAGWLEELHLTPYQAFLFMRAERYPDLMRRDKPASLDAISRLLPQGQGQAYDQEQARLAQRLHDGGMTRRDLRTRFGVSQTTLTRWLDPERYAQEQARARESLVRRRERLDQEAQRRREAAMKAKGGPSSRAYQDLRRAIVATDEAARDAHNRGNLDEKQALDQALAALYRAEDKLAEAHGVQ
jgi:hypothetical protein